MRRAVTARRIHRQTHKRRASQYLLRSLSDGEDNNMDGLNKCVVTFGTVKTGPNELLTHAGP